LLGGLLECSNWKLLADWSSNSVDLPPFIVMNQKRAYAAALNNGANSMNVGEYNKSVCTQTSISLLVVLQIFCVLSAVKLYDNPFFKGHEVNNICFNRLLPAKLDTFKLTIS